MELWRVYTHTAGDESVTERLVAATTDEEAKKKAKLNVKSQNLGKGDKSVEQSRNDTKVLFAKKCGKDGVIMMNRIPLAVVEGLMGHSTGEVEQLNDFYHDMCKLVEIDPGATTPEEVTTILGEMVL